MSDRERLLAILYDIHDDIPFETECALIDDGHLSSLDIAIIVTAINDIFDVSVRIADLEPENFNSVDAMLELIERKRNGR